MNIWKIVPAILLIFLAGAVLGGVGVNLYQRHNQSPRFLPSGRPPGPGFRQTSEFLRRLDRQLSLSSEQHQHIETILRESQERVKKLYDPIRPQAQAEFKRAHDRIRAELTSEQQTLYDQLATQRPKMDESAHRERRWPPSAGGLRESTNGSSRVVTNISSAATNRLNQ